MIIGYKLSIASRELESPYDDLIQRYYRLLYDDKAVFVSRRSSCGESKELLWEEIKDNYLGWGKDRSEFIEDLENAKDLFFSKILSSFGMSQEDFNTWEKLRYKECNILRIDTGSSSSYIDLKRVSWINIDEKGMSVRSNLKNHSADFSIGSIMFFDDIRAKPIHVLDAWERLKRK